MAASHVSHAEPSLGDIVGHLKDSASEYARAEFDIVRAKAGKRVAALKMTAILGVVALLVVQAAIVTLLVGAVWALSPYVGPALATIIVVAVALGVVFALLKVAIAKIAGGGSANA